MNMYEASREREPIWGMSHVHVWGDVHTRHASCICMRHESHTQSYVRQDVVEVTRLIHMRDMTHEYAWHDSLICVTWLIIYKWCTYIVSGTLYIRVIQLIDMTLFYARTDSFIWLLQMRNVTHLYVWNDWFIHIQLIQKWLIHIPTIYINTIFIHIHHILVCTLIYSRTLHTKYIYAL